MYKKIQAKRWLVLFMVLSILFIAVFMGITYIVDPYFQYRVKDNSYMLSGWYVGEGLIKNYEYDTLIIGSSMTQNFDMDLFREKLNVSPLHVGLGGMNWKEMKELLELANRVGKAKNYYICVDLYNFTNNDESDIPKYLLEDTFWARVRYSLAYESWFGFMPVDIGLSFLKTAGYSFPKKYAYSMSIDHLEDWSLDYSFGEEIVLKNYQSKEYSVSDVDTENLLNRMLSHIDTFVDDFDRSEASYHFFFPPYSSLYWCDAQDQGYYDVYIKAKKYFSEKMIELGYEVYDFQSEDFTMDLNNYRDTTHYKPDINDWMVLCFAQGDCLITSDNYFSHSEKLLNNTNYFRKQYHDLF